MNGYEYDTEEYTMQQQQQEEEGMDSLPSGWIAVMDSTTNQVYYVNVDTGELSWSIPTEQEEEEEEQSYYFYHDDSNQNSGDNDSEEESIAKVVQSSSLNQKGTSATPPSSSTTTATPTIAATVQTSESIMEEESPSSSLSENDSISLPDGWMAVTDPNMQEVYYANAITGESTWDHPGMDTNIGEMEEERLEDSFEEEDVEHVQESSLPVGWMAVTDPESQEVYYANPSTGESSWDSPGSEEDISNDETTIIVMNRIKWATSPLRYLQSDIRG